MWQIEFAAEAERDFALIFEHLVASYEDFGDPTDIAFDRAAARIASIQDDALRLARQPFQGTLRSDILETVRFVRLNRAVFWFQPDENNKRVRVLAVFFGAQDHINHMLLRLLSKP